MRVSGCKILFYSTSLLNSGMNLHESNILFIKVKNTHFRWRACCVTRCVCITQKTRQNIALTKIWQYHFKWSLRSFYQYFWLSYQIEIINRKCLIPGRTFVHKTSRAYLCYWKKNSPFQVKLLIDKLNLNKPTGNDGIGPCILKACCDDLSISTASHN
jgi:hypothetical protein